MEGLICLTGSGIVSEVDGKPYLVSESLQGLTALLPSPAQRQKQRQQQGQQHRRAPSC